MCSMSSGALAKSIAPPLARGILAEALISLLDDMEDLTIRRQIEATSCPAKIAFDLFILHQDIPKNVEVLCTACLVGVVLNVEVEAGLRVLAALVL